MIAADAFRVGDVKRGEEILRELPESERTVARCTRAKRKRYYKDIGGWDQVSDYRLYRPLIASPVIGHGEPSNFPYKKITVGVSKDSQKSWVVVLGDLGPTKKHPKDGEQRYLVNEEMIRPSQTAALNKLGYDVVVPCANVPLSGHRLRRKRR
jgi:hypothetical protein